MPKGQYDAALARRQERVAATADMRRQRRFLCDALALQEGESVLELGSGNGFLARDLRAQVGGSGRIAGVDASEAIVAMAEEVCPQADFHVADAADLPFGDASFDRAVAAQLLCFLPDVDRCLREIRRVVRPGGRVVLLDTDWDSLVWNTREPGLMRRVIAAYTDVYADAHVPRTLSRRLEQAGFAIAERFAFTILNLSSGEDTYAGQSAGFAVAIMRESDAFTEAEIERWRADQQRMLAANEYWFSLNRYVFVATRP